MIACGKILHFANHCLQSAQSPQERQCVAKCDRHTQREIEIARVMMDQELENLWIERDQVQHTCFHP